MVFLHKNRRGFIWGSFFNMFAFHVFYELYFLIRFYLIWYCGSRRIRTYVQFSQALDQIQKRGRSYLHKIAIYKLRSLIVIALCNIYCSHQKHTKARTHTLLSLSVCQSVKLSLSSSLFRSIYHAIYLRNASEKFLDLNKRKQEDPLNMILFKILHSQIHTHTHITAVFLSPVKGLGKLGLQRGCSWYL